MSEEQKLQARANDSLREWRRVEEQRELAEKNLQPSPAPRAAEIKKPREKLIDAVMEWGKDVGLKIDNATAASDAMGRPSASKMARVSKRAHPLIVTEAPEQWAEKSLQSEEVALLPPPPPQCQLVTLDCQRLVQPEGVGLMPPPLPSSKVALILAGPMVARVLCDALEGGRCTLGNESWPCYLSDER